MYVCVDVTMYVHITDKKRLVGSLFYSILVYLFRPMYEF